MKNTLCEPKYNNNNRNVITYGRIIFYIYYKIET